MNDQFQQNIDGLLNLISTKPGSQQIIISLLMSGLFSILMWIAYKISHDRNTYHSEFGITMIMLALISTVLMDLIQSNLALSLGMLGSLSIVRFRTNIKDYRDIGFIFWAMAIGIASATKSYAILSIGSILLAVIMIVTRTKMSEYQNMMLVIRGSCVDLNRVQETVSAACQRSNIKAKNMLQDSFELVYEIEIHERKINSLIAYIFKLNGVDSVNVLAANT